jgi:hypothetical protein
VHHRDAGAQASRSASQKDHQADFEDHEARGEAEHVHAISVRCVEVPAQEENWDGGWDG